MSINWELEVTRTSFKISGVGLNYMHDHSTDDKQHELVMQGDQYKQQLADAKLIAEAGTVKNETGYTPRELAEQKKALLEACENLKRSILNGYTLDTWERNYADVEAAIAAATN